MKNLKTFEELNKGEFNNTFTKVGKDGNTIETEILYMGIGDFYGDKKMYYIIKQGDNHTFCSDIEFEPEFKFEWVMGASVGTLDEIKNEMFWIDDFRNKTFYECIKESGWIKLDQSKDVKKQIKLVNKSKQIGIL